MTTNTPTVNSKDAWVCIYNPATNEAYDIKIVAIREKNGQEEFKVHYQGWNKNKDKWMPASRLVKGTLEEYRALNPLKEAEETPRNGGAGAGSSQQAGTAPKPSSEPKPIVKPKANGARLSGAGPSQPAGSVRTGAGPSTEPSEQKPANGSGAVRSQPTARKMVPMEDPESEPEEPEPKAERKKAVAKRTGAKANSTSKAADPQSVVLSKVNGASPSGANGAGPSFRPAAPVFAVKDVCLCRYSLNDDRVYKATILEIREKDGQFEYKVHCLKWNPRFDQWFPASRLFKGTMVEYLRAQLTS